MKYVLLVEDETPIFSRYFSSILHRNASVVASPCRFPHIYHGIYLSLGSKGRQAWIALWELCMNHFESDNQVAKKIFARKLHSFFEQKCVLPQVLAHNTKHSYSSGCKGMAAFRSAMEESPFGLSDKGYDTVLARCQYIQQRLEDSLTTRLRAALIPVIQKRRQRKTPLVFQGAAGMKGMCKALECLQAIGGDDTLIVGQHSMGPKPADWAGEKPFKMDEIGQTLKCPDTGHNTTIKGCRGYHGEYYKRLENLTESREVYSVAMCSKYDELFITRYSGLTSNVPDVTPLDWKVKSGELDTIVQVLVPGDIPKWRQKLACNVFARCSTFAHDLKLAWYLLRPEKPAKHLQNIAMTCVSGRTRKGTSEYGDTTVPDALFHTGFELSDHTDDLRGKRISNVSDNYVARPDLFDAEFRQAFKDGSAFHNTLYMTLYVGDPGAGHLGYAVKSCLTGLDANAAAVPQDCDDDMALDYIDILHDE